MTPESITVVQMLALAYLRHARAEQALALLAALDAVAPGRLAVLRALAFAQLRSGQARHALDTLERAAGLGGQDAAFHLMRARALAACGRRGEARIAMSVCLALHAETST